VRRYDLKVGETVYFKCTVVEIKDNCCIRVKGANLGEDDIEITTHPNSLIKDKNNFSSVNMDEYPIDFVEKELR